MPREVKLWDEIAAVLNSLKKPVFKVTFKSVRDRYGLLVKKYKTKWNEEEKSSVQTLIILNLMGLEWTLYKDLMRQIQNAKGDE